jgi:hypothetical protein
VENNKFYSTEELAQSVESAYARLEQRMQGNEFVYAPLNVFFEAAEPGPRCYSEKLGYYICGPADGRYCYSDDAGYHYRIMERGGIASDTVTQSLFEITYRELRITKQIKRNMVEKFYEENRNIGIVENDRFYSAEELAQYIKTAKDKTLGGV